MSPTSPQPSDHERARVRAYELIQDLQATDPNAATELAALAEHAARRGWGDVARAGVLGRAVSAWYCQDGSALTAVATLIERSRLDGDQVMLALGLAMRSDPSVSGGDPATTTVRDEDLVKAMVLLEPADGAELERITGHTACGNALYHRGLFELCDEQYGAALVIGDSQPPGSLDFVLAPIMFNRAEVQVAWASTLYQLGDQVGVAQRWASWKALSASVTSFELPEAWRVELTALGLLLRSMAAEDTALAARRLLGELSYGDEDEPRSVGLLKLAAAVSDAHAAREGAGAAAEAAVRAIDPNLHGQLHDLALYIAAEIEAGGAEGAGLRYARRQLSVHWSNRLASLGSMQSRVQAERLASERELLSRHARLDDLTGIGNRRALDRYVTELMRLEVATVAILLLDVDSFKEVNDRHGHLAGDAVLVGIARILERSIRPSDIAVRLGGDEFAVVLSNADLDAAIERACGLLAMIDDEHFEDASPDLAVALSVGVAVGAPSRMTELRGEADAALYRAKAGRGRLVHRSRLAVA
jgi:diguanylate cyclase (GGDEF)-like protein